MTFPGEADLSPRQTQLLRADGEAHPAVPAVHPPPAGPAEGLTARGGGQDGAPAGPHHAGVSGRDAEREEERVRAGGRLH